jgi:hypothetical protein
MLNFKIIGCQIYKNFKTIYLNLQTLILLTWNQSIILFHYIKTYNVSELIPPSVFRWKR